MLRLGRVALLVRAGALDGVAGEAEDGPQLLPVTWCDVVEHEGDWEPRTGQLGAVVAGHGSVQPKVSG